MVASIDRADQNGAEQPSQGKTSRRDNLQTEDATAVAASMKNDPFRYYAERDAGISGSKKRPINPKDPFSYYYDQEYEAQQEVAAQTARQRATEIQAKHQAPTQTPRPRSDAEMSMSLGAVAGTTGVAAGVTKPQAASDHADHDEHPLQRWGREDREAREAANRQLQQGVTQLKDAEEQSLAKGKKRVLLTAGLATSLVVLAGGAYVVAPKLLDAQAEREQAEAMAPAGDDAAVSPSDTPIGENSAESAAPTENSSETERSNRSNLDDSTSTESDSADGDADSDRRDAVAGNGAETDQDSLAASGTLDAIGADDDQPGSRRSDPDDVRDGASRRAGTALKRDEILAPLGLNGGNFVSWWRGEPVNPEGGSRANPTRRSAGEERVNFDDDSDELDGEMEFKSEGSGLRFGSNSEDESSNRQTVTDPRSSSSGRATVSFPSSSNDSDSGNDGYSVPSPGGGLLFGDGSDSSRVPAVSMTNETVQLSILGITNAIPQGIDAPVQDEQRVGSYRVTDTYLPCQSSDASDCRDVHPVYGYHSVPHFGVDIAMPNGAPVFAVGKQGSTVSVSCYTESGAGLVAQMSSSSMPEYEFKAMHLSDCIDGTFDVGTIVAAVGASGGVTGPHLHWEAFYNGARVDPPRWSIEYAIKGNITRDNDAKFTY